VASGLVQHGSSGVDFGTEIKKQQKKPL